MSKDISSEFLIIPWKGGVKLEQPNSIKNDSLLTVKSFFQAPLNLYVFDKNNTIIKANEENIIRLGFSSDNDVIGKNISDIFKNEICQELNLYHLSVFNTEKLQIREEYFPHQKSSESGTCISFKFPLYDHKGFLNGILGCSIIPEAQDLPMALHTLIQYGFLANSSDNPFSSLAGRQLKEHYLSKRELDCLKLLIIGKTAKETGKVLGISFRTVEAYMENIKSKLNVHTRAELFAKAFELGLTRVAK